MANLYLNNVSNTSRSEMHLFSSEQIIVNSFHAKILLSKTSCMKHNNCKVIKKLLAWYHLPVQGEQMLSVLIS